MQAALHEYTSATRRLVLPVVPDSPYARSVQLVAQPALFGILRQPTQPAHYATYPVALTLLDAEGKAVGGPYIAAAEHRWGERMEGTTLRQAPDRYTTPCTGSLYAIFNSLRRAEEWGRASEVELSVTSIGPYVAGAQAVAEDELPTLRLTLAYRNPLHWLMEERNATLAPPDAVFQLDLVAVALAP